MNHRLRPLLTLGVALLGTNSFAQFSHVDTGFFLYSEANPGTDQNMATISSYVNLLDSWVSSNSTMLWNAGTYRFRADRSYLVPGGQALWVAGGSPRPRREAIRASSRFRSTSSWQPPPRSNLRSACWSKEGTGLTSSLDLRTGHEVA